MQREELEPFTWSLLEAFEARGEGALRLARGDLARAVAAYEEAARPFDAVLTPTVAAAAWPLGRLSGLLDRAEALARTGALVGYTPLQNAAGCPAMSVPLDAARGRRRRAPCRHALRRATRRGHAVVGAGLSARGSAAVAGAVAAVLDPRPVGALTTPPRAS
ncbi:MAG: amidase family protein [Myxococcales bacterium]